MEDAASYFNWKVVSVPASILTFSFKVLIFAFFLHLVFLHWNSKFSYDYCSCLYKVDGDTRKFGYLCYLRREHYLFVSFIHKDFLVIRLL